jgi:O-methyltransferase domain
MPPARKTSGVPAEALPPGHALYQMAMGHFVPRALALAAKLGIADLLKDGPRSASDLAVATQTHAPSLARVARLLASVGVFAELPDGTFALTPLGEPLRADAPGSVRALVLLFAGVEGQDCWKDLEYCVRTGDPSFRHTAPGTDPYALMARSPELTALFDQAMATFAPWTAAAVAAAIDFSAYGRVVDVGGGNGALLIGILTACPGLAGVVFDQPHAMARAREQVAAAGLTGRCQVIAGSFFDDVPPGADAYLLCHVLVDWDDERAAAILRNCRAAMPRHGRILILEEVYPARIDPSDACRGVAAIDVLMLVCTGGRQRSEEEFRGLLAASGFRLSRVVPTAAGLSVVQAEPA